MRSANVSLHAEALTRIATVNPAAYSRTRRQIGGAVSGLSPYLTHGVLTSAEALAGVAARHRLAPTHPFVAALGRRAHGHQRWRRLGDALFHPPQAGPLPEAAYATEVPADVREARCGLPVIDVAVQTLYRSGTLHHPARQWLASYLVHLRKVHWRAGADWMWSHLLDGDLASNHLAWQGVAGGGGARPWLFNAEAVARHAPAAWHSSETVLDSSLEALERLAHSPRAVPAIPAGTLAGLAEPPLLTAPTAPWRVADAAALAGRAVWLVHPWALRAPPADLPADTAVLAWWPAAFHRRRPWSGARWAFVQRGLAAWAQEAVPDLAPLAAAASVGTWADPHVDADLPAFVQRRPSPPLFAPVAGDGPAFAPWWAQTLRGVTQLHQLPGVAALTAGPLFDAAD